MTKEARECNKLKIAYSIKNYRNDPWRYSLKIVYSINGVRNTGQIHAKKNKTRLTPYTMYKNKFKMD